MIRISTQGLTQRRTMFDFLTYIVQKLLERFIFRSSLSQFKALNQRKARFDHGRKLAKKNRDIFTGNLLREQMNFNRLSFDLEVNQALSSQGRHSKRLIGHFQFAAVFLTLPCFTLPEKYCHTSTTFQGLDL